MARALVQPMAVHAVVQEVARVVRVLVSGWGNDNEWYGYDAWFIHYHWCGGCNVLGKIWLG